MARSNRNSAKNRPVVRVKSQRVDRAAKALMEDFKVTDLHNSKVVDGGTGPGKDLFADGRATPTQQQAARGTFDTLSKGIVNALGFNQGKVNVDLGDGLVNPVNNTRIFPEKKK